MRLIAFVCALAATGCDQPAPTPTPDPVPTAAATAEVMDECPHADKSECGQPPTTDDAQTHFGKAFALQKNEALAAAITRLADSVDGETVQVKGTVDAVCKKKGCWMVLRDGDTTARVFTYAGEFFLPIGTLKGRQAKVEGKLKPKVIKEGFAKHLAEDKGDSPDTVKGDQREWVVEATAVELL